MDDRDTSILALKAMVQVFVDQRQWQPFHDPKNLAMSIAIEAAELMEHFQWLRTDQLLTIRDDCDAMAEIREEIADVFCYVLSFASIMGIDLASALEAKMVKNREKYPVDRYLGRF